MKKIVLFFLAAIFLSGNFLSAQENFVESDSDGISSASPDAEKISPDDDDEIIQAYKNQSSSAKKKSAEYSVQKKSAPVRRPQKHESGDKILDRSDEYVQECRDIFKYGLEGQIISRIDDLTKNEDTRFVDEIYDLFGETKSIPLKEKILDYFAKLKDPCLANFAVEIVNDPYDAKKSLVEKCFKYVAESGAKEAVPGLVDLVQKEEDDYFSGALSALGELGEKDEAIFLADYIDRTDLTMAQKQSLMKVLGRIRATETWDKIAEIAQNEDENSFVRMYAAEALGAMGKSDGEKILVQLFESDDPNLRVYVVKGISYFSDKTADDLIIQALRDGQYKVRYEAVCAIEKRKSAQAVPYLIFRCKDKSEEKNVKEKCYSVLASMNDSKANEYLVSLIKDKKTGDSTKAKVASVLLQNGSAGTKEILELAESTLKNDAQKNLRYALGKEFAKYSRSEFASICEAYLSSSDVATQGTGLDIWARGKYSGARKIVEEIAADADDENSAENSAEKKSPKKKNANAKKAKKILSQ